MRSKGMTLIELIIGLTVIGIAFYLLISIFVNLVPRTALVETLNKKVYLAQEKMEEYLGRSFSSAESVAATSFTGSFADYKYQIVVTTVESTDLNAPVAGPTDFKNVKVRVWGGPVDAAGTVEIVSLVTSLEVK